MHVFFKMRITRQIPNYPGQKGGCAPAALRVWAWSITNSHPKKG
jgi:hypothetical protein